MTLKGDLPIDAINLGVKPSSYSIGSFLFNLSRSSFDSITSSAFISRLSKLENLHIIFIKKSPLYNMTSFEVIIIFS